MASLCLFVKIFAIQMETSHDLKFVVAYGTEAHIGSKSRANQWHFANGKDQVLVSETKLPEE